LTAVERYALTHIEHMERYWKESQLAVADAEIQAQKREFDAKKLDAMTEAFAASNAGTSATPTEAGSTTDDNDSDDSDTDDERSSQNDSDDSSDDDNSTSSEEEQQEQEEEGPTTTMDDDNEDTSPIQKSSPGTPLSPRTRSRGDVRINLWTLDK
jgi:hypothetical protein